MKRFIACATVALGVATALVQHDAETLQVATKVDLNEHNNDFEWHSENLNLVDIGAAFDGTWLESNDWAATTCYDINISQFDSTSITLDDNNQAILGSFQRTNHSNDCTSYGYFFDTNSSCPMGIEPPCGSWEPGCEVLEGIGLCRQCASATNNDFFSSGIRWGNKRPFTSHQCWVRHRFSVVEIDDVRFLFNGRWIYLILHQETDPTADKWAEENRCYLALRINLGANSRGCDPYPHCGCWTRIWDSCCSDPAQTDAPSPTKQPWGTWKK